jgi:polyisoprenoid-binding protein YceI
MVAGYRTFVAAASLACMLLVLGEARVQAADTYTIDPVHSSVSFQADHAGISRVHGRFDQISGSFTIDKEDPSKSSFELTIQADSVDTNNKARDGHLKSPDFFNVRQFPAITFKSTSVKPVDGGYDVQGDLTMHGQTKPVSFMLKGGKEVQFPPGVHRTGFTTDLTIKRTDFGMSAKMLNAIADEALISVGIEGTRK